MTFAGMSLPYVQSCACLILCYLLNFWSIFVFTWKWIPVQTTGFQYLIRKSSDYLSTNSNNKNCCDQQYQ